ncbi:hypothetical protein ACOMHN_023526 [Nucella lapillus]
MGDPLPLLFYPGCNSPPASPTSDTADSLPTQTWGLNSENLVQTTEAVLKKVAEEKKKLSLKKAQIERHMKSRYLMLDSYAKKAYYASVMSLLKAEDVMTKALMKVESHAQDIMKKATRDKTTGCEQDYFKDEILAESTHHVFEEILNKSGDEAPLKCIINDSDIGLQFLTDFVGTVVAAGPDIVHTPDTARDGAGHADGDRHSTKFQHTGTSPQHSENSASTASDIGGDFLHQADVRQDSGEFQQIRKLAQHSENSASTASDIFRDFLQADVRQDSGEFQQTRKLAQHSENSTAATSATGREDLEQAVGNQCSGKFQQTETIPQHSASSATKPSDAVRDDTERADNSRHSRTCQQKNVLPQLCAEFATARKSAVMSKETMNLSATSTHTEQVIADLRAQNTLLWRDRIALQHEAEVTANLQAERASLRYERIKLQLDLIRIKRKHAQFLKENPIVCRGFKSPPSDLKLLPSLRDFQLQAGLSRELSQRDLETEAYYLRLLRQARLPRDEVDQAQSEQEEVEDTEMTHTNDMVDRDEDVGLGWGMGSESDVASPEGVVLQLLKLSDDGVHSDVLFHAKLSETTGYYTSTQATIVCDRVVVNLGHGYDAATGIFRAPVPGIYLLIATSAPITGYITETALICLEDVISDDTTVWEFDWKTNVVVRYMTTGDGVSLVTPSSAGAGDSPEEAYIYAGWGTTFTGVLLLRDDS